MRILSGIKPSGNIHIGNYFGMIKPMLQWQEKSDLFCFVADLHSQTTLFDANKLRANVDEAIVDLISLGIDPDRSTFWVQSDVPEVTELTWYLSNVTPVGLLQRSHAYKDATAKEVPPNMGLFGYPVLMAADILLYQSDLVPVGQDQKQHLEITRDIAVKFNNAYKEVLTVPEPQIQDAVAIIPGLDGQKMSKSYGNVLELSAAQKPMRKKIMGIVTDSTPVEDPKDPDNSIIYAYYKLFVSEEQALEMAERFRAGGMGYGDAKKALFEAIWDYFADYRTKREEILDNKDYVAEIRKKGADKARKIATETLDKVREAVGTR